MGKNQLPSSQSFERMWDVITGPRIEQLKTWLRTSSEVKVIPYDMYQQLGLSEFDEIITVVSALDYVKSSDVAVSPVFYEYAVFGDIREEDTDNITRAIEDHLSTTTEVSVDYDTYMAGEYIYTPTTRINLTMTHNEVVDNLADLTALFEDHPDLTLVMDVSANEDGVLNSIIFIPETLRNLKVVNSTNDVISIGDNFLYNYSGLTRVDFTELPQLTSIGDCFLYCCKGLRTLNFMNLPRLTTIEDHFLNECRSLQTVRVIKDSVAHRMIAEHKGLELEFVEAARLTAPAG